MSQIGRSVQKYLDRMYSLMYSSLMYIIKAYVFGVSVTIKMAL